MDLKARIRAVPDFPKPGILFRDITPLLADPPAFAASIQMFADLIAPLRANGLIAIESRGFLFAAPLAIQLNLPLQLVRKKGKLPYEKIRATYALEYGTDTVEMHADAISSGQRYVIIDDLIATGGTAKAAAELVEGQGGIVAAFVFLVELEGLRGRDILAPRKVLHVLSY